MRKPKNEVIYDAPLEAVDSFSKEFDGIDQDATDAIQEVWDSGIHDENIDESRAGEVKNRSNS